MRKENRYFWKSIHCQILDGRMDWWMLICAIRYCICYKLTSSKIVYYLSYISLIVLLAHFLLRKKHRVRALFVPLPPNSAFPQTPVHIRTHIFQSWCHRAIRSRPASSSPLSHHTIQNTTTTTTPSPNLYPSNPNSILLKSDSEPTWSVLLGVDPLNEVKSSLRFPCLSSWKKGCHAACSTI